MGEQCEHKLLTVRKKLSLEVCSKRFEAVMMYWLKISKMEVIEASCCAEVIEASCCATGHLLLPAFLFLLVSVFLFILSPFSCRDRNEGKKEQRRNSFLLPEIFESSLKPRPMQSQNHEPISKINTPFFLPGRFGRLKQHQRGGEALAWRWRVNIEVKS